MYQGTLLEFLNMGGGEIMLIMVVVLLLFGGKKLPELARGLGKGIREFKDASEGVKREIHRNINAVDIADDLKTSYNTETPATSTPSIHEQMYGTSATEPTVTTTEHIVTTTDPAVSAAENPVGPSSGPAVKPAEPIEFQKNNI
jgi:sec-independent protein translocase protein TatA